MSDRGIAIGAIVLGAIAFVTISAGLLLSTIQRPVVMAVAQASPQADIGTLLSPTPATPIAGGSASPAVSPTPGPSPSMDPAVSVAMTTVPCVVQDAGGVRHRKVVRTEQVSLTRHVSGRLTLFAMDDWRVLAPAGWRCLAEIGGNGTLSLTVAPKGDDSTMVMVYSTASTYGDSVDMACPFFADAARRSKTEFGIRCSKPPSGETVTRVDEKRILFVDDIGVEGAGAWSGGLLPVAGGVFYVGGSEPTAAKISCAIGGMDAELCATIVADWLQRQR